jgi:hypothetical protein
MFLNTDWWEIKFTALGVTFQRMSYIVSEYVSAGSREVESGRTGVMEI